jgi:hypothetical protein
MQAHPARAGVALVFYHLFLKTIIMKKIKFLSILVFQLFLFQAVNGQSAATDENGRPLGSQPVPSEKAPVATAATTTTPEVFTGNDQDIPGSNPNQDVSDWVFPGDLDVLNEELSAGSGLSADVGSRLAQMEVKLNELLLYNEQLRLENRMIRKSMEDCCSANGLGLTNADAYLMQNAPNPFSQSSKVSYFVPKEAQNARLEISHIGGELIQSFDIEKGGAGSINIEGLDLKAGTYIYSLFIGNDLIDSKVMIFTP